jgi:hypothetical protein
MHADEREVLIELIASVRTLAKQTLTLHLQLGAVRAILARKGTITNTELNATLTELGTMTVVDDLKWGTPSPDEVFDDLLRRLGELD